jgi:hypothetical protein
VASSASNAAGVARSSKQIDCCAVARCFAAMDFKPPALMRFMRRGVSSKGQQSKGSGRDRARHRNPGG